LTAPRGITAKRIMPVKSICISAGQKATFVFCGSCRVII
jgi:hypothetical protein